MRKNEVLAFVEKQQRNVMREVRKQWRKKKDECCSEIIAKHSDLVEQINTTLKTLKTQVDELSQALSDDPDIDCYTVSNYSLWGHVRELTQKDTQNHILSCSEFNNSTEFARIQRKEDQELDTIKTNYHNLYTRCSELNGKKGTEYLQGLGYILEKESQTGSNALMAPIDIEFLRIDLTKPKAE